VPVCWRHRMLCVPRTLALSFLGILCGLLACDPVGPQDRCERVPLNANLRQLFYWGEFGFPNRGRYEAGGVDNPVWAEPGRIYVATGYWNDDVPVDGIFAVDFAASGTEHSFTYRNFSVLESPHHFWTLEQDAEQGRILFIASDGTGSWAGRVAFDDPSSETELVGADWRPWGIAAWPGRSGIVFYGRDPVSGVDGFYWRAREPPAPAADSLLHAVSLSKWDARGMAIDRAGRNLFFASGDDRRVQFLQLPLDRSGQPPTVLAERAGGGGAIHPNPTRPHLVLIQYTFGGDATRPPQSHIELLDVGTLQAVDLDVRTETWDCRFIVNDHASWSPDGNHFAFAAGGFDGEGDRSPLTLWIRRDVALARSMAVSP
jgi:hypothetical protein